MMPVGGIGARPEADGESALINYMGNCSSQPVEVWEAMHPLRVGEYRLREDSAGAGRRRGGFGLCLSYEALADGLQVSVFTERQRFAPPGLHSGCPAVAGEYWLERDGEVVPLQTKTSRLWLRQGDRLVLRTAGGAGYGDPLDREPELVAEDVRQQLVSPTQAKVQYGVVARPDGTIDVKKTADARTALREARNNNLHRIGSIRDDGDVPAVWLPAGTASSLKVIEHQILYCSSAVCGVYAEARISDQQLLSIHSTVAEALDMTAGDHMNVTPMRGSWLPHSTTDVRRRFSIHQFSFATGGEHVRAS
jgi:hypothetical protein